MKAKWKMIKARYEAFIVRERILMVGAIVAVLYLTVDFMLLQPMGGKLKILQAKERNALQGIKTTQAEMEVLVALAKKDPNITLQKDIDLLEIKLAKLDDELSALALGLVPSEQLPQMLHDVLKSNQKLTLQKLQTLPAEQVLLNLPATEAAPANNGAAVLTTADTSAAEAITNVKLYKHGVVLSFKGSYPSVVNYLQALESGPWKFYWDRLEYNVKGYPDATVKMTVFTLASDKGVFDG